MLMKDNTKKKAPYVAPPSKDKPNYMKEADKGPQRKNPQAPMTKKRLSK